ncbi:MAG: penicillin-binding protein 1C, partial [FCB group bacterium]
LSGAEMAVPLLFSLFNSIDYDSEKRWFDKPANVSMREVCEETGLLPSRNCKNLISDYYIKNVSAQKVCNLYKEIFTNQEETIQYCTECLPKEGYKKILIPEYEPELALWYENNNIDFKKAPPHNPDCQAKFSDEGPKIISPSQNYDYYIEEKSNQQILLQAASSSDNNILYWYINNQFYKNCKPNEKVFFRPGKGKTNISCLDDKGRKSNIIINVKFY